MLAELKSRARALKTETHALYLAARDPRTPWFAKGLVSLILAYALSPIDLIPDFVPVLGYLDDLIIVPGGIWLAIHLIPPEALEEAQVTAAARSVDRRIGRVGAALILLIWIVAILWVASLFLRYWRGS